MSLLQNDDNGVRILTLDRPEVRNALNGSLREALSEALTAAKHDDTVRALVLTGAGDAFCAGLDLANLQTLSERSTEANRDDSARLADLFLALYTHP